MAIYKNTNSLKIEGLKEIRQLFENLPKQIKTKRIWNNFFKEISKPLVVAAKDRADAISNKSDNGNGVLGRSIKYYTTKRSRKNYGGLVGPRVKGAYASKKKSGFYGAWIEFGSKVKFGNQGYGKDQPFLAPAYNSTVGSMNINARKSALIITDKLLKSYEKRTKKYGTLGR